MLLAFYGTFIVTATFIFRLPFHTQSSYIHQVTTSDDKNTTGGFLSIFKTSNIIVNMKFQLLKDTIPYFGQFLPDHPVQGLTHIVFSM